MLLRKRRNLLLFSENMSAYHQLSVSSKISPGNVYISHVSVYNWCELKAKMWVLNLGKPVSLPVYNEDMAIELGANLLGEAIIFLIAAGLLVAEYNR